MSKNRKKVRILGGLFIGVSVGAILLVTFGMSNTIGEISDAIVSKTPTAILASSELLKGDKEVLVPVAYFDQRADKCADFYDASQNTALQNRQFEWTSCGYYSSKLEQGLFEYELDKDYYPVAVGGEYVTNRGVHGINKEGTNLYRWFNNVEGKSKNYVGNLKFNYKQDGNVFSYDEGSFYPLDDVDFSKGDLGNDDGHNHLFTLNFAVPFTAVLSGNEIFEIAADDDTFVYIGDDLVIDMGGVHDEIKATLSIEDNGEIYVGVGDEELAYSGLNISRGEESIFRIIHADRDSKNSIFRIKFAGMNLSMMESKMAGTDGDGVQIAYDPANPTYVAPLGESLKVRPDGTKGLIVAATIQGVLLIALVIFLVSMAKYLLEVK